MLLSWQRGPSGMCYLACSKSCSNGLFGLQQISNLTTPVILLYTLHFSIRSWNNNTSKWQTQWISSVKLDVSLPVWCSSVGLSDLWIQVTTLVWRYFPPTGPPEHLSGLLEVLHTQTQRYRRRFPKDKLSTACSLWIDIAFSRPKTLHIYYSPAHFMLAVFTLSCSIVLLLDCLSSFGRFG